MTQRLKGYYLECPECNSRYFTEPMTLAVRKGALVKIHPICTNCFENCSYRSEEFPNGHTFGSGEYCNVCGVPRRRFDLIRHELEDPNDPIFGDSTQEATADSGGTSGTNVLRACRFSLSEAGDVTKITIYFTNVSGSYHCYTSGFIYDDNGGYPGTKKVESSSRDIQAGGWQDFTFATTTIIAGTYWLGCNVNVSTSTIGQNYYKAGTTNQTYIISGSYGGSSPSSPATFPGSATGYARNYSYYVTYNVATLVTEQLHYRWYQNDVAESPTAMANEDSSLEELASATVLRLRLGIKVNVGPWSGWTLKLQYATSITGTWTDVGAQGGATIWRYYNGLGTDQNAVANRFLTGSDTSEHFVEAVPSATIVQVAQGGEGEWDFCIQENGAIAGTVYYFRIVKNDGTVLVTYTRYPNLITYPTFTDYGTIIQYDPTKYGATVVYFEAQIKTSSGTIKAYSRLWNIGDNAAVANSLVSTVSTSYSRQRSSSISLPATAKEFKAQVGANKGASASIKGARLIVDAS